MHAVAQALPRPIELIRTTTRGYALTIYILWMYHASLEPRTYFEQTLLGMPGRLGYGISQ